MMISREDVAKTMWRVVWVVSNHALAPASPLTEEEWAPAWRDRLTPGERDVWRTAADAVIALIQPEVPVQRDERAEKLGELLGATERQLAQELANLSATAERCHVLEERAQNAEALAANLRRVDNERAIELMRVKRELAAAQAAQHDALAALGVMREALEDGLRRHEKFVREHALDTSKYPDAYIHVIRRALSLINHA